MNQILTPVSDDACISRTARVVRIEPERGVVYLAFLRSGQFPKKHSLSAIENNLAANKLVPCEVAPPASVIRPQTVGAISRSQEICDKSWSVLEPLVSPDKLDQLFDLRKRAALLLNRAKTCNVDLSTIYKQLARYFEGGMTKLALIPRYRSVPVGSIQPDGQKRRGPKPRRKGAIRSNFMFTAKMREKMEKFLLEKYRGTMAFKDLTDRLNNEFFIQPTSLELGNDSWLPESERPTPAQYRRFLSRLNRSHTLTKKLTRHDWNLKLRPVKGNSRSDCLGPGHKYQIDATGTQVHVVSMLDPSVNIGTATLYFAVDLYSSAIVGTHVTLQEESWDAIRFAIFNTFMPKAEIYRRAGLKDVSDDEVPFTGLCMHLIGDRGELVGTQSMQVVEDKLAVRLGNTRSRRGDDKAVVERLFRTIKSTLLEFIKGHTEKHGPPPGARDPKVLAVLNMQQLTQLIYEFVRYWNNKPVCEEAIPEVALLKADTPITPLGIWNWGLKNRTGQLRQVNPSLLYGHLLPTANASVEDKGIRFRGWVYQVPQLNELGMQTKARRNGNYPVQVKYDESQPEKIWLWIEERRQYIECLRHDPQNEYTGWSFADHVFKHQRYLERADEAGPKARKLKDAIAQTRLRMEAEATHKKAEAMSGKAKTVVTMKMRANRYHERPYDTARNQTLIGIGRKKMRAVRPLSPPVLDRQATEFYEALRQKESKS